MHDIRVLDHPTHYAIDMDALAELRGYSRLPLQTGLWSLEQACRLFIAEAAITDPGRTCYYHEWQDVTRRASSPSWPTRRCTISPIYAASWRRGR